MPTGAATDEEIYAYSVSSVVTVTLNRPKSRNAMNLAGWRTLRELVVTVDGSPDCRVIVIRGAEANFGAGLDISEFATAFSDRESASSYFAQMESALAAIEACRRPVIAAIEGLCFGANVALALACDVRIASAESSFAITPAKLGIAYPYGDLKRVRAAIGHGQTKLLLVTGRRVHAGEAHRIGLIDVLAADDFDTSLSSLVDEVAQSSPYTINATKAALRSIDGGLTADEASYPDLLWSAISGIDFVEGMQTFAEKRKPQFRYSPECP